MKRKAGRPEQISKRRVWSCWRFTSTLLLAAVCCLSLGAAAAAEVIDRVLAVLPGQIITKTDVEAAIDFGFVDVPAGGSRIEAGLSALIDRALMLNEVRRVQPPEPAAAALDARLGQMRRRFATEADWTRALAAHGVDEAMLRAYAADDLRLATYLDERFSASSQPTEQEVRQAGEAMRAKLAADRRQMLVSAWIAELRRRTEVTLIPLQEGRSGRD